MLDENKKANFAGIELQKLSVPELEKLLCSASQLPEEDTDEAFYDLVEQVLLQKEQERPSGRLPDVDKAWADFQTEYKNFSTTGGCCTPPEKESVQANSPKKPSRMHRLLQHLATAAAAVTIVVLSVIVAQASGIDVLGAVARWTEDTFHFKATGGYAEGNNPVMHLQEAIGFIRIPESLCPLDIPDDYEIASISTTENEGYRLFACSIINSDKLEILITIIQPLSKSAQGFGQYEKDANPVEECQIGSRVFYLFSNNNTSTAAWSDGQYSISVFGGVTVPDMRQILNSLYGGN